MKKVCVSEEKCIGCGACVAIAPENFDFNDEGLSIVKNEEVTENAIEASEACPVYAIEITEEEITEEEITEEETTEEETTEEETTEE